MTKFFLMIALLLTISACQGSDDDLIKKVAIVYAELRIAEREYGETENGKAARFKILQRYKMDADVFEEKMNKIKDKPEKWLDFQNRYVAILDSIEIYLQSELDSAAGKTKTKGGT
ncbi:MAG: hypothetical protein FWF67_05265 [Fibromonadales bacterium]|nr:hypothetical protein [Fibromonadales bacterium]